jgi:hypothetical protein
MVLGAQGKLVAIPRRRGLLYDCCSIALIANTQQIYILLL